MPITAVNSGPAVTKEPVNQVTAIEAITESFKKIGSRDPAEYSQSDLQTVIAHMELLLKQNPELANDPDFMATLDDLRALNAKWNDIGPRDTFEGLQAEYQLKEQFLAIMDEALPNTEDIMYALGDLEEINNELDKISSYLKDRTYTSDVTTLEDSKIILASLDRLDDLGLPASELDKAGLGSKGDTNYENFSLYTSLREAIDIYEEALSKGGTYDVNTVFADLRQQVVLIKLEYAKNYGLDESIIQHHQDAAKAEQIADMDPPSMYDFLSGDSAPSLKDLTEEDVEEYITALNLALSKCPKTSEFEPVRLVLIEKLKAAEDLQHGLRLQQDPTMLGLAFRDHTSNAEAAYYDYMIVLAESTGDAKLIGEMESAKKMVEASRDKAIEALRNASKREMEEYAQQGARV